MAKKNEENEPQLTEAHREFLREFNNRGGFEGIERELKRDIESDKQITTLKIQLAKHGGHTADCATRGMFKDTPHKCDCGWAALEVK